MVFLCTCWSLHFVEIFVLNIFFLFLKISRTLLVSWASCRVLFLQDSNFLLKNRSQGNVVQLKCTYFMFLLVIVQKGRFLLLLFKSFGLCLSFFLLTYFLLISCISIGSFESLFNFLCWKKITSWSSFLSFGKFSGLLSFMQETLPSSQGKFNECIAFACKLLLEKMIRDCIRQYKFETWQSVWIWYWSEIIVLHLAECL